MGDDGAAAKLLVDIGIWEWNTVGVYDLSSGTLQELAGQLHTDLLPLHDGRVLLYGNSAVSGEPALHVADSLDNINTYTEFVNFSTLTGDTLFAEQAIEVAPGQVRVFGPTIPGVPNATTAFYFDVDMTANTTSSVNFVVLSANSETNTVAGSISPDGALLPVHLNALWTDAGSIYGALKLLDLTTGQPAMIEFPDTVGAFRWQS